MESTKFIASLHKKIAADRIKTRSIDLYAYASDAGFYEIVPIAVCFPVSEAEIIGIITLANVYDVPITFRAGGTSLSGQTVGEGLIVDLSRSWKNVSIMEDSVKVQPGVTGGVVNQYLKKKNQKIGPDPSSINAAMMGGILSNNASGMCCGVQFNSYHTLKHIRFILADGSTYDTAAPDDYARFEKEQNKIFKLLKDLKAQILSNESLFEKIRAKYQLKNTVGYGLNSFVDYEHPLDILAHLLIGAEGTLAFISEAVLHTLPDKPYKATSLLVFEDIVQACNVIPLLKDLGAESLELMDRASLASVEQMKGMPAYVAFLPPSAAALLCEYQSFSEEALDVFIHNTEVLQLTVINNVEFTKSAEEQALLWKIRKGMFPAVGAVRAKGTTVVLEDVAFPLQHLSRAVMDLQDLFKKYHYKDAIIFGHAKDGNLHFVVTQSFDTDAEVQRYAAFMDEVVDMVVYKYQGTLKAEHGTGRNMAPFVKTEWGDEAYDIMKQIKAVVDPNNIFNRGVIINPDALVHLKNFKKYPVVEAEVDKCIECGFCEQSCPSKHVTLTPRKRIVIRRAQKRLREQGNTLAAAELDLYYQHDGIDTCAVDGMCASDCPVQINTGDLIKKLRKDQSEWHTRALAMFIAKNTKFSEAMARFGLKFIKKIRGIAHYMPLAKHIPDSVQLSRFAAPKTTEQGDFLIFTSCISRIITNQEIHDADYIAHIAQKTKLKVDILPLGSGLCCGQAFSSKGYERAAEVARKNVIDMLWKLTDQGRMPVIVDVSSCSQQFMNYHFDDPIYQEKYKKLKFLDSIDFIYEHILPKISVTKKLEKVTLHPNCSTHKMNKIGKYQKIAAAIAQEVHIPIYATCCGMAGDRGFIVPELTESAVAHQVAEVQLINAPYHCSTSVSCNINLSKQTGKQYESLYSLIHKIL